MSRRDLLRGDPPHGTPDLGVELIIAEGDRDLLSPRRELSDLPCWSAVFAGGLKTTQLPPDVRRIVIAADNDVSGAGQRNALAAYDRWTAEGREVRIKTPPEVGDDFNDVLSKRRVNARH